MRVRSFYPAVLVTCALACAPAPTPQPTNPDVPVAQTAEDSGPSAAELLEQGRATKNRDESAALFKRAAERAQADADANPKDRDAWANLGKAHFYMEHDAAAAAAFERALALDPKHGPAHFYLGLLRSYASRPAEALPYFQRATEVEPDNKRNWFQLGRMLLQTGKPREAIAAQERAAALDPKDARIPQQIGDAHAELGEHESALAAYERSLALDPADVRATWNAGQVAQNLNQSAKAAQLFAKVLQIDAKEWRAYAKLTQLYQSMGDAKRRDKARQSLLALRKRNDIDDLKKANEFCRDQFSVGARTVFAMEPFPDQNSESIFVFKVAVDKKVQRTIVYGFNKTTNAIAKEQGSALVYHLEISGPGKQQLLGMHPKLDYDAVKSKVVAELKKPKKRP